MVKCENCDGRKNSHQQRTKCKRNYWFDKIFFHCGGVLQKRFLSTLPSQLLVIDSKLISYTNHIQNIREKKKIGKIYKCGKAGVMCSLTVELTGAFPTFTPRRLCRRRVRGRNLFARKPYSAYDILATVCRGQGNGVGGWGMDIRTHKWSSYPRLAVGVRYDAPERFGITRLPSRLSRKQRVADDMKTKKNVCNLSVKNTQR